MVLINIFMIKHTILAIFLLLQPSFNLSDRQERRLDKLIEKVWDKDADEVDWGEVSPNGQKYENDLLICLRYEGETLGYLAGRKIADNYLNYFPVFAFDHNGEVLRAYLLEMNTIKGSEINTRFWLRQFQGYHGETIRYGKDIDAISGATLSGMSMTKEVKYYSDLINSLIK